MTGRFLHVSRVETAGAIQKLMKSSRGGIPVRPGEARAGPRAVAALWCAYTRRKIIGEKEGASGGMDMRRVFFLMLSMRCWRVAATRCA